LVESLPSNHVNKMAFSQLQKRQKNTTSVHLFFVVRGVDILLIMVYILLAEVAKTKI